MRLEHGGKYTCGPTTGISDSVMVHVIAGKYNLITHIMQVIERDSVVFLCQVSMINSNISTSSKIIHMA